MKTLKFKPYFFEPLRSMEKRATIRKSDKGLKKGDIDDVVFKGLFAGNWACRNFLDRRDMSELGSNKPKVYYGKVGCLGYIIAEDEFESIEE